MRHPLHPMLVHFPVACWSLATVADVASLYYGQPAWHLAGILAAIGVAMALPAMLAGLVELVQVPDGGVAMRDAYLHMSLMMLSFGLYLTSLLMRVERMHFVAPGITAIIVSVGGFISLILGGWVGGRLVYGHGIGGRMGADAEDSRADRNA